MKTLRDYLSSTAQDKIAIGHFNVSNLEGLWAVFEAAQKVGVPVIIGVSEGERHFMGLRQCVALVQSLRKEFNFPIFLNADHTYSFEKVKEVVDAGVDAVIFDGTELPFDENLKITRRCVEYARAENPEILVEGELDFIGRSSKVFSELPAGVKISEEFLTKPEEAKVFATGTGIDLLAPAVGNIHGMLKGGVDPALDLKRLKEISEAVMIPLVLHGGSGNSAEDFRGAMERGVSVIHINTELRVAYRKALALSLQENLEEIAPYKYLKGPRLAMEKVVEEKLKVFNRIT